MQVCIVLNITEVYAQFKTQTLKSSVNTVQPFTGIVLWTDNDQNNTSAIQLEYSYMLYSDVVSDKRIYEWSVVDKLLQDVANRKHQLVLRF